MSAPIVPVVAIDLLGREFDAEAPLGSIRLLLGVGRIGVFEFDRTKETNILGRPIYRQVQTPLQAEAVAAATDAKLVN